MKVHCCPNAPVRKIARRLYEAARDVARRIAKAPEHRQSRGERKNADSLCVAKAAIYIEKGG